MKTKAGYLIGIFFIILSLNLILCGYVFDVTTGFLWFHIIFFVNLFYSLFMTIAFLRHNQINKNKYDSLEAKFNAVFNWSRDGILFEDIKGHIVNINSSALKKLEINKEDIVGKGLKSIIPEDQLDLFYKASRKLYKEGKASVKLQIENLSGKRFIFDSCSAVLSPPGEKIIMIIARDITLKEKSRHKIMHQSFILDHIEDVVASTDNDGNIRYMNRSAAKFMGMHMEDIGEGILNIKNTWIATDRMVKGCVEKGSIRNTRVFYNKDNEKFVFDINLQAFHDKWALLDGIIITGRDITSLKAAEVEVLKKERLLRQAQKIEAIGTLAGGIAHDFNNLLYIISGNCELLLAKLEDKSKKHVLNILNSTTRGADLVRRLLTFSRNTETKLQSVDLNEEIRKIIKMLTRVLPKMISIELELDDSIGKILGDAIQIEQVVMNLCLNARDVMPDGGEIIISTTSRFISSQDEDIPSELLKEMPEQDYIILEVRDTGSGISVDIIDKIFDPFFTTKEFGKGSGLGLAIIYGIVKSHNGFINCLSDKGCGTTFSIYFPVPEGDFFLTEKSDIKDDEFLKKGKETILVVDDESSVVNITQKMLKNLEYNVISAGSGEVALDIYIKNEGEIDLVILDLGMPGMGGEKTLERLMAINPLVKIIVTTGYTEEDLKERLLKKGALKYLTKPVSKKILAAAVRSAIDDV